MNLLNLNQVQLLVPALNYFELPHVPTAGEYKGFDSSKLER